MIYVKTITTNLNTSKDNPLETVMTITKGLIFMIEVEFPAGCSGLVHIQILDGGYQLFPATPGEYLRGDNANVRYDDTYLKMSAPYVFKIITYNEDTVYNHTVQIRIGIASTEAFMARYLPNITWDKFAETLAQAQEQQQTQIAQTVAEIRDIVPVEQQTTEEQP